MGFHGYNFSLRNEATLTEDLKSYHVKDAGQWCREVWRWKRWFDCSKMICRTSWCHVACSIGYKSKAFPCDKGRVNTLPTTSFVLSGIMVQLLLEKQGYLAKRRKKSPSKRCWAVIHTGFEMAKMVWLQHWFWHMPFRKMQGMEHKLSCRSYVLRRLWNWASGHRVGGIPREKHLQFLQCIQGLLNWLACSISSNHFNHKPVVRHLICSILMHV